MRNILFVLPLLILIGCSPGYKKIDGKWAYVTYNEAVGKRINFLKVDNETFKVLSNEDYASDKKGVYLFGSVIENADPNSFHVLDNGYSADKNNVFLDDETVINADPKSFVILDFPYSKDKQKIFCGTLPLATTNVDEFVVVESGSRKTSATTSSFIQFNPEYAWIDTTKYKGVVYGDGKGKTRSEKFDGYEREKP